MKSNLLLPILVCLFFIGCNYNIPQNPVVEENTNTTPQKSEAQLEAEKKLLTDDPLILSEVSDFKTIPCNNREIEISEDATASNYKLTGDCKKVTVAGVSNKVTVDKVGEIIVSGSSNKVVYSEGLDGKKPKITKSGISTSVDSAQSLNEKKAKESK
jgi:hypothetical protein